VDAGDGGVIGVVDRGEWLGLVHEEAFVSSTAPDLLGDEGMCLKSEE
jgi:hypothetical protein